VRITDCFSGESTQFICSENHLFEEKPIRLFHRKTKYKCPICSKESSSGGYDAESVGHLYFATVIVNDLILYKVGITNRNPQTRLQESFKKFYIYKTIKYDGKCILNIESYIKRVMKPYRAFPKGTEVDCESGYSEVYTEEPRQFFTKEEIVQAALGKI
jgi:hypothetical protein